MTGMLPNWHLTQGKIETNLQTNWGKWKLLSSFLAEGAISHTTRKSNVNGTG